MTLDAIDAVAATLSDATPSTRRHKGRRNKRVVREARVAASITSVDRQPVAQRRDVERVLGLAFASSLEQFVLIHHLAPVLADLLALVDRDPSSQPKAHRARVVNLDGRVGPPLDDGIHAREAS